MNILRSLQWLSLGLLFLLPGRIYSQTVDTVAVYSPSMKKEIKNVIVLPAGYEKDPSQKYPVLYLLHGHGGHYGSWINPIKPDLPKIASDYGIIVVCPEGEVSWYWDSPVNPESQYETYVSKELLSHIDTHYRTWPVRQGRAITGLSMGGHGGLWLGFRHPDLFGACGSMSGGVDIRPFPDNWNMKKQLGTYADNQKRWDEHTVINQIPYDQTHGSLAIIINCGTEDFFYEVNQNLHAKLLELKIPHDYIVGPGGHTSTYWNGAIDYQLLFFNKFFRQQLKN